ncbi:hypothetical protein FXO38_21665 [Capsicum annuum]|nr:hypothetical protein FXO38_21665 [Capsicum annuum]KAF3644506.1 hypothetical protein FXO37_21424 [Capsicum annuum]
MVDQLDQVDGPIGLLEYTTIIEESFVIFNKEGDMGVHEGDRVVKKRVEGGHFNEAPTTAAYVELENEAAPGEASSTGFVTADGEAAAGGEAAATAEAAPGEASSAGVIAAGDEVAAASEAANTDASDFSTENSSDSDHEDLFIKDDTEFESDVHEEDIKLSAERRKYQKRKRREIIPNDPTKVPVGEVGPDLGFEETKIADKSLKGKVVGDEPVYFSFDEYSVDSDLEDGLGRTDSRKVVYDDSAKQVVWQLGMVFEDVNEFRDVTKYALQRGVKLEKYINESKKVRVRCREGCHWLLYASINKSTNDFQIKTYNPKHRCIKTTRNSMCNAKFLPKHFKDRISEQLNVKIFQFQQLIRKKLGIHVGKSTVRRARGKILQDLMGNHVKEFERIFDYRDEILRSNPGSTCVVKVDDSDDSAEMKKNLNQLAMLGSEDIVPDLLHYKVSVGSSILNVGPSDVPSTSRPKGRPRNISTTTTDAPPRPRRRPRKISDNPDVPLRPRGRPRKTTHVAPAANVEHITATTRGRERGVEHVATVIKKRERGIKHIEHVAATTRKRGRNVEHATAAARGRERSVEHAAAAARGRGRSVEHIATTAREREKSVTNAAAAARGRVRGVEHAAAAIRGRERGIEHTAAVAIGRKRGVGHVAVVAVAGRGRGRPRKTSLGDIGVSGLPSSRILHTGSAHPIRSADITGDLGYK